MVRGKGWKRALVSAEAGGWVVACLDSGYCRRLWPDATCGRAQPGARQRTVNDTRLVVVDAVADRAGDAHRFERRGHDLGGTRALVLIGQLRLEQFRMREDDAQLVVQAVEEQAQIARIVGGGRARSAVGHDWCWLQRDAYADARATFDSRIVPSGERQRVSTKIRMLPPAVRTYSTLPAAIQL